MVIAWVVLIKIFSGDMGWIGPHINPWIRLLRVLSSVIVFASSAIAVWNLGMLLRGQRKWLAKLWGAVIAISCLALLYVAVVFHLVGYSAKY